MRIISGTRGGHKLKTPSSRFIRPTSEKVREACFHILYGYVEGARVLDLFCGTGAMGLEALSRGAEEAVFVDRSRRALSLVEENLESLDFQDRGQTAQADLTREWPDWIDEKGRGFDLIFADPPYDLFYERRTAEMARALKPIEAHLTGPGVFVLESPTGSPLVWKGLPVLDGPREYGKSTLWFYGRRDATERTADDADAG